MTEVRDNPDLWRYELEVDGKLAIAAYERRGGAIAFTHSEVPETLQGQGVASRLIAGALADVRRQGLKVVPICEFVAAYLDRHAEDQDLIAADAPG
jgi:predicted GNAT family acetyltransferase